MKYVIGYLLLVFSLSSQAKPLYKVDRAIRSAASIVVGEVHSVDMIDSNGMPKDNLKAYSTRENSLRIRHHIRIIEHISGPAVPQKEFIVERPVPAYFGKEKLAEGLKSFYFLTKDGTPIDGEFRFNLDRRPRILEVLKTKKLKQ